jgi:effector-binding domain-containing protein
MSSDLFRLAIAGLLAAVVAAGPRLALAQEAPATPPSAQSSAPTSPAPTAPPSTPAETTNHGASSVSPDATKPVGTPNSSEPSTGETVDLPARPFAYIEGKADRDEIYSAILGSLGLVKRDMDKVGVAPAGRPIAVFLESDDTGFKYHAGYPLEAAPEGKSSLSEAVKIGQTPGGKAMRFEHQGSYADIDATYDAITAYLDEKGIDAQDYFIEEYANDVKDPDDPTLQVNIYVLLK